jgi:FtsP/CotA-like multicopper oxidase with cupredoxin domain
VTPHKDEHSGHGETHPEWWGKLYFRHLPNHGFVGDIFTVNGKAFPVLEVKPRTYRLRFLDASIARIYEFKLMRSAQSPNPQITVNRDSAGFWRIRNGGGWVHPLHIHQEEHRVVATAASPRTPGTPTTPARRTSSRSTPARTS